MTQTADPEKTDTESSSQKIRACIKALCPLADLLLPFPLTARQRRSAGAYLFTSAPYLVRLVGAAMEKDPALFRHYPTSGTTLLALQERARTLQVCCGVLRSLLELANDDYLTTQATATRKAMEAVQLADRDLHQPLGYPDPRGRARRYLALRCGAYVLEELVKTRQKSQHRNEALGASEAEQGPRWRRKKPKADEIRAAAAALVAELLSRGEPSEGPSR